MLLFILAFLLSIFFPPCSHFSMDAIASSFTVSVLDCELAVALVLPTFGVGAGVLYPRWDEERNLLIKLFWEIYFFVPTSPPSLCKKFNNFTFWFPSLFVFHKSLLCCLCRRRTQGLQCMCKGPHQLHLPFIKTSSEPYISIPLLTTYHMVSLKKVG